MPSIKHLVDGCVDGLVHGLQKMAKAYRVATTLRVRQERIERIMLKRINPHDFALGICMDSICLIARNDANNLGRRLVNRDDIGLGITIAV